MATTFIGNTEWQQVEQETWNSDNWGMDTARVLFRGRAPAKKTFEDSLQRWSPMPNFGTMKLQGWSSSIVTPSFPGVELSYLGFRKGDIPPMKPVDGVSTQSASGSGIDSVSGNQVSGTFLYRAARTTYTWFETQEPPDTPRYKTVRRKVNPLTQIISYSLQNDSDGKKLNNIPYSSFVAIFNSLRPIEDVTDYQREMLVPGQLWGCQSTVDYRLSN